MLRDDDKDAGVPHRDTCSNDDNDDNSNCRCGDSSDSDDDTGENDDILIIRMTIKTTVIIIAMMKT